jgi:hypothetical protein
VVGKGREDGGGGSGGAGCLGCEHLFCPLFSAINVAVARNSDESGGGDAPPLVNPSVPYRHATLVYAHQKDSIPFCALYHFSPNNDGYMIIKGYNNVL